MISSHAARRSARQRLTFALSPVAAGCALMLMMSAASAQQAAADAPKGDAAAASQSVTVTGIRRGIEDAISVKKNATNIVESISAEDIGKLPDVSIAESIARLPGLAAQRVAGRASVISVRGLSPDFATTLLNGREQVSTGDNRGVEFDQYPSELLSGVTVYKAPDAALVGQGLSGTLDLQTVRPLAFAKRTMAFNVRGERNSLGSGVDQSANGSRFSAMYIDQFSDRTVGLALGFAHLDSPIIADEFGTYGYSTDGRSGLAAGTSNTNGLKTYQRSGKNTRDGFVGVLEFRPNKNWTSTVDGYYSKFKRSETARGIETNLGDYNGGNQPGLNYTATTIDNNTLVGGTATGVYPLVRGLYNKREDTLTSLGWNNKLKLERATLTGDLSYSKAERRELNLETNGQYVDAAGKPVLDTVTFNLANSGFPTTVYGLNYADPARIQVGKSIYGAGYGKAPSVNDELKSARLEASIPLAGLLPEMFDSLDVGINYANRLKTKRQPEASLDGNGVAAVGADQQFAPVGLGFAGAPSALTWSVPGLLAANYKPFMPTDTASYLVQKGWDVSEKVTTTYARVKLESDLGSVTMRGNFGIQVQHTDQSSSSNYFDNTAAAGSQIKPVVDGKKFNDVLPSMNLAFGFASDQTLRIAAAKQIARPRLDQMKSAFEFSVDNATFKPSANGGNPRLDPWRANAYDISYEKYFANKGYVSAAAFYKDLKSYIYQQTIDYDFATYTPGTKATTTTGKFTAPYNGQGGSLKGFELTASIPLKLITPSLDGFGVIASYSYNDSQIAIDGTNLGDKIALPGLSRNVSNLTMYYENAGWSTRLSGRKRSDYIGEISGFGADRELRYVKGETIVDFQLGYAFGKGAYDGLSVLLQVNNLTDSVYQTYQKTQNQPVEYQKYGRTVLFGLNYKL